MLGKKSEGTRKEERKKERKNERKEERKKGRPETIPMTEVRGQKETKREYGHVQKVWDYPPTRRRHE